MRATALICAVALATCGCVPGAEEKDQGVDETTDTAIPDLGPDPDPDAVASVCGEILGYEFPYPLQPAIEWEDFDLTYCEDKPDCHHTDGTPPGCPNACNCLCYGGEIYVGSCTLVACPDEPDPCYCCAEP